jgi:hypothetical protein
MSLPFFVIFVYNNIKGDLIMAKLAQCGYGSQGQGLGKTTDGYTYVVNDNVRTGDRIQVVATSKKGNKFATTAVPLHTYKENSVKGQKAKQEAQEQTGKDPTQSYSGKELGVQGSKATKPLGDGHRTISEYAQETRAGNLAMYMQKNPNATLTPKAKETFDSYSKQFMNKENNNGNL